MGDDDSSSLVLPLHCCRTKRLMRTILKYILLLLVFMAGCNSDQYTKRLARESLKHNPPLVILTDYVELCYVENTGGAFSLLSHLTPSLRRLLLICIPLITIVFIAYLIWHFRTKPWYLLLPLLLILSGATGNLLDRLRYGYVVDFIHLHVRNVFHWHIFNVADGLIFIGSSIFLLQYVYFRNNPSSHVAHTDKSERVR